MGYSLGRNVTRVGRLGSRARSWDRHVFPLVLFYCLPAWKIDKWQLQDCEQGCERNSSQSDWRGVTSHKCARVHHIFKSAHLILKQKLYHRSLSRNLPGHFFCPVYYMSHLVPSWMGPDWHPGYVAATFSFSLECRLKSLQQILCVRGSQTCTDKEDRPPRTMTTTYSTPGWGGGGRL